MPNISSGPGTYKSKKRVLTISAGAYGAGDVIGGLIAFPLNPVARGGRLKGVRLFDLSDTKAAITAYIFRNAPATIADNAAFALSDSDLPNLIAVVPLTSYIDLPSNAAALAALDNVFVADTLYVYLVATATPTFGATSALQLALDIKN